MQDRFCLGVQGNDLVKRLAGLRAHFFQDHGQRAKLREGCLEQVEANEGRDEQPQGLLGYVKDAEADPDKGAGEGHNDAINAHGELLVRYPLCSVGRNLHSLRCDGGGSPMLQLTLEGW